MTKKAFITGITGQDGVYLTELLLSKGYEVHGLQRRSSLPNTARLSPFLNDIVMHSGDVTDSTNLTRIIAEIKPDEIYNLAAQSHVHVSFDMPEYTANTDGLGTLRLLEAIRILGLERTTKFFQASTSELYGLAQEMPQNENTPFYPRSPYAAAKLYAYWVAVNYREAYDIFACNGILFNHESPLRGEEFVTRKITKAVAAISRGEQDVLYLGNLEAKRDWGHARDYMEGVWRMMQQEAPEDYVLATGVAHSVREFVELAFDYAGLTIEWQGEGIEEVGIHAKTGKVLIQIDSSQFRPTEVDRLLGNSSKAYKHLGWKHKTSFQSLVAEMVNADLTSKQSHNDNEQKQGMILEHKNFCYNSGI